MELGSFFHPMKTRTCIWLLASACSALAASPAPNPTPSTLPPSKLDEACAQSLSASITREAELEQKFAELWKQVSALSSGPGSDPKKPLKDWMTPAQLDQFYLLTAQMRYISFSIYGEVTKRREIRAISNIVRAEEKGDQVYAESIGDGGADLVKINEQITLKLETAGLGLWNAELNNLVKLQFVTDAQSVPINSDFIPKLNLAKSAGPRQFTDDVGFMFDDNLKTTVAYKFFIARLNDEIKAGNQEATVIRDYLGTWSATAPE